MQRSIRSRSTWFTVSVATVLGTGLGTGRSTQAANDTTLRRETTTARTGRNRRERGSAYPQYSETRKDTKGHPELIGHRVKYTAPAFSPGINTLLTHFFRHNLKKTTVFSRLWSKGGTYHHTSPTLANTETAIFQRFETYI